MEHGYRGGGGGGGGSSDSLQSLLCKIYSGPVVYMATEKNSFNNY